MSVINRPHPIVCADPQVVDFLFGKPLIDFGKINYDEFASFLMAGQRGISPTLLLQMDLQSPTSGSVGVAHADNLSDEVWMDLRWGLRHLEYGKALAARLDSNAGGFLAPISSVNFRCSLFPKVRNG